MGGKIKQTNEGQATGSYNAGMQQGQQTNAAAQEMQKRQTGYLDTLFGAPGANGKPSGGGTLSGFTDPNTVNTTAMNPTQDFLYKKTMGDISGNAQAARSGMRENMANRGFASGSGMENAQSTQLALGEAGEKGQAYGAGLNATHNEALSNFWNANNIMTGTSATLGDTAAKDMGTAASVYGNLYGTAGQGHMMPGIGSALIGAAGAGLSGYASNPAGWFCPAEGSLILMGDRTWKLVEDIHQGESVLGIDGDPDEVIYEPFPELQTCVIVSAADFQAKVSILHTFQRRAGGYALAGASYGEDLNGAGIVQSVALQEMKSFCRRLMLKRSHGYCNDGFWSLE